MTILRLSAALTLLLAGAGCAQRTGGDEARGPTPELTSTALPSPGGSPDGLPVAMQPNESRPDPRVVDLRPVRWSRVEAMSGRDVRVHYTISGRGDCSALGRVEVTETTSSVTLTVQVGRLPEADCTGPQPLLAASIATVVRLAQPLGTRTVRDGAAG